MLRVRNKEVLSMKIDLNAQLEVLNRFSYMLDEHSVRYLAEQDPRFREFVEKLYGIVDREASSLIGQ